MSTRLHIVVSEDLVARIDAALGAGQPRADFIRRAVEAWLAGPRASTSSFIEAEQWRRDAEQALSEAQGPVNAIQADPGSVPSAEGVRSAAPAEQPKRGARAVSQPGPDVSRIRSSAQVQRAGPQPKGGKV